MTTTAAVVLAAAADPGRPCDAWLKPAVAPRQTPALGCAWQSPRRLGGLALSLLLHLIVAGLLLHWRPAPRALAPSPSSVVYLDLRGLEPTGQKPETAAVTEDRVILAEKKIHPAPISPAPVAASISLPAKVRAAGRKVALAPRAASEPAVDPAAAVEAVPSAVTGAGGVVAQLPTAPPVSAPPENVVEFVEARPQARHSPPPPYPEAARRRGQQGLVRLAAEVSADGRVRTLELVESCGVALLDRAALAAVRDWLFEPARRRGVAEISRVVVPVQFQLQETQTL